VLGNQGCNNTQRSERKTQLEVQGVVDSVVKTFMTCTELTAGGLVGIEDLFDAVTNPELGAIHVTRDDEQHGDRQVVMRNVSQPEGLSLGMETT
jgi:hypothetical protein